MKERKVSAVKVKNFNRVVGGGRWPQRNTIKEVLGLHKSLSWQLSSRLKAFKRYLQVTEKPHKGTVTKYENEISFERKRVAQNARVIQAMKRYGLLDLDKGLNLPVIPYIFRAVEEETRLQDARDKLRLSDSFESSEAQIDFMVQQLFAGFLQVNETAGQFYPEELPEILKFIRSYGNRHKYPKGSGFNVAQYVTREILTSYLLLLRLMYHQIFFAGVGEEKPEADQERPESSSREGLRVVK